VLIEMPAETQAELNRIALPGLEPPVALVVYNETSMGQALYFPFARFSPEWQAAQWALAAGIPVRAIDLPAIHAPSLRDSLDVAPALPLVIPDPPDTVDAEFEADPLKALAIAAGYEEVEPWWDATFEQESDDVEVFAATLELMNQLRPPTGGSASAETLLREAYMRQSMRKAYSDGFQRIAVVCGAWHGPALDVLATIKATSDRKLLNALPKPKVKLKTAWIPWSYPQLARESGYGAGVTSPAWYDLRFDYGRGASVRWLARAGQLLREEGIDNSPAHVLEALRLAEALAAMRQLPHPNLTEVRAAALSVLCEGVAERLELIERQLVIGARVGIVPPEASVVPLQQDLAQQLRSLRLQSYWGKADACWLKATAQNPRGGLDLREASDLQKSYFLHRLIILNIPWAEPQAAGSGSLGSFKEVWRLEWKPDFSLRIIEAAMWGNTIAAAAATRLQNLGKAASSLAELVDLLQRALLAGLPEAAQSLTQNLRQQSAVARDVFQLLPCVPALVGAIQYGDVRRTDVTALAQLVYEMTPRMALGLPAAARQLDEDAARSLLAGLMAADRALHTLQVEPLNRSWQQALLEMADGTDVHPLLKGAATRLLFDRRRLEVAAVGRYLSFALSLAQPVSDTANWLEGFLPGSGMVLLHHPALRRLVDEWLAMLDEPDFMSTLPVLRRTFSRFSPAERQLLFERARLSGSEGPIAADVSAYQPHRRHTLLSGLKNWIGDSNK
jgi:hypothetical protein